ncbi:MAG TPA: hypothetical protein VJQ46_08865, partial [Gemmatimonadales bacterium]|nr:hypothetical protein [Gemmatimonadales bacterium]
ARAGGRDKPAAAAATVRTAARPSDACGWISVAEVEAIVGKLTGPARPSEGTCIYPLPVDPELARRRAKALELQRKLEERFGKAEDVPELVADESAVIVDVQEYVDPAGARGAAAAGAIMAGWIGEGDSATKAAAASPAATEPGWDATSRAGTRSFVGGLGHMRISVRAQAVAVTREQTAAIANRIRDKIPDLPFPSERSGAPASPDPCVLVTVQEVEAVVGKLVVPPFRSDEGKPLAMENGASCTYYTAGHHALVLTPTWSYGGAAFEAMKGVGGLLEGIAPALHNDAADTLDSGPWDDAAGDPATGALYFLKGDRALEVHYLVSGTDMNGAVRLASIAVGRL